MKAMRSIGTEEFNVAFRITEEGVYMALFSNGICIGWTPTVNHKDIKVSKVKDEFSIEFGTFQYFVKAQYKPRKKH